MKINFSNIMHLVNNFIPCKQGFNIEQTNKQTNMWFIRTTSSNQICAQHNHTFYLLAMIHTVQFVMQVRELNSLVPLKVLGWYKF